LWQTSGSVAPDVVPDGVFRGSGNETLSANSPAVGAAGVLNPPRNLRASVNGTRVTLAWDPPDGGGVTTYVVLFKGAEYPVGNVTAASGDVPAGTYLVAVLARYASGDSAAVTVNITVGGQPPNPPRNLRQSVSGTVVTLTWDQPAEGGGPVTTYVLLFQGSEFPLGNVLTKSGTVAPGKYLVGLLARNAAGDSAAATVDVTVAAEVGSYSGPFRGSGTITRRFVDGTCSWKVIYAGNISVTVTPQTPPFVGGSVRVSGTWSASEGTSSTLTCIDGSGSYDSTGAISGTSSGFSATTNMDLATGTFTGGISGTVVIGSLTADYRNGTGTVTMGVTLPGS
jgi:hypothetical protein